MSNWIRITFYASTIFLLYCCVKGDLYQSFAITPLEYSPVDNKVLRNFYIQKLLKDFQQKKQPQRSSDETPGIGAPVSVDRENGFPQQPQQDRRKAVELLKKYMHLLRREKASLPRQPYEI